MRLVTRLAGILTRGAAVLVIALSVWAYCTPSLFAWMTSYTSIFLAVIMFGMGLTLSAADFKVVLSRPREVLLGALLQYTVMPLAGWALATALALPDDLALGVILVACCPGGTASNVVCHIARGDVALSVAMTVVSTLLAPIATPALVWLLAGSWVEVSFVSMMVSVLEVVVAPVVLGVLAHALLARHGSLSGTVSAVMPAVSSLGIALIVAGIIAANASKLAECGPTVLAVVVCHNAAGLLVGWAVARLCGLSHAKVSAVAIEVGLQNSGLAVTLAAANFAANPLATLPGAIFSMWQNIAGSLFAALRAR